MSGLANLTDPSYRPLTPIFRETLVQGPWIVSNRAAIVINAGVANNPVVTPNDAGTSLECVAFSHSD